MENNQIAKVPTLAELIEDNDQSIKENALMVLLNQNPPDVWLKKHPTINDHVYLPINRVEWLLSRIFTKWWVEVKNTQLMANSVIVTVRVYVQNPLSKLTEWNEGVGAAPIQTDKGKGAMDWNFAKAHGVQIAAPIAESFAIKDAAEKWGKVFGKDLNRKDVISYDSLLASSEIMLDDHILPLYDRVGELLTPKEKEYAERIINNKEKASYQKLYNKLNSL